MIWQWLKSKKPEARLLKQRNEAGVIVAYGNTLEIYYLNSTAATILAMCDGKHTLEDIEQNMLSNFEVKPEILRKDLITIIRDLQWKRLLIVEE